MKERIKEIILESLDEFVSLEDGNFIVVGMDGREENVSFNKLISKLDDFVSDQIWHATIED